jgi:hypothetical protein
MVLWWIANVVLLVVVIPVVVLLLHRLRRPVLEIRRYADDVHAHTVPALAALDAVADLADTRDRVRTLRTQVASYGASVARILGSEGR